MTQASVPAATASGEANRPSDSRPRLGACFPVQAYGRSGDEVGIRVQVSPMSVGRTKLQICVYDLDQCVACVRTEVTREDQVVHFGLPGDTGMGYGLTVSLLEGDRVVDRVQTAIDVQQSWIDAPRYGFLSQFTPGEEYELRATEFARRHINVVQFYDWMYRHYEYLPPEDSFKDALGRELSLTSVRRAVESLHSRGAAAMAYGSVYGAEPEYALTHPQELLYDGPGGKPISLIDLFYLQDVRPGPWRETVLRQYRRAIRDVGFDGIHADQYGFPKEAYDSDGDVVDMALALAGMVRSAQEAVVDAGGDGIIFNCVENWPIAEVAPEPQACMYIEVWPPYTRLQDLHGLVKNARELAPTRQVILAAYMSCAAGQAARDNYSHWANGWGVSDATSPDAGQTATLLTSAAIHASGGFHLLLGEGNAILADPYYPNFVVPGTAFQQRIIDHWDFIVRYTHYLFDRSLEYRSGEAVRAGGFWAIHRSGPAFDTLSLINAAPNDEWNALKPAPPTRHDVLVEMPSPATVAAVFAANPDGGADARRLDFTQSGGVLRFRVPGVTIWTLIVIQHDQTENADSRSQALIATDT